MRILVIAVAALAMMGTVAEAQSTRAKSYIHKDGTYVAPSWRTKPNSTRLDNYSTKGNVNPYTGRAGTVEPYKLPNSYPRKRR